jgi:hypothetical protein
MKDFSFGVNEMRYILTRALKDKKLSNADLKQYSELMNQEISELQDRLRTLRGDEGTQNEVSGAPSVTSAPAKRTRSRKQMSPDAITRSRQIQGEYIRLIRNFPVSKRNQYKQIVKKEGREAAIARMAEDLGVTA